MLFLDGVYIDTWGATRFRWVKAPTSTELTQLTQVIARRVGRFLERQGLLERDAENSYLAGDAVDAGPMAQLRGHSITYRIAIGSQQGRKVFTLQTLPAGDLDEQFGAGNVGGFSLHAGVATKAHQRKKLERLCRYIARPAISEKRLSLTGQGKVRYELKTPYRDGTTHVIFEPLDFIAKLAALVPKPRVNLTRFHGVFTPNSKHRVQVTPAKRGKDNKGKLPNEPQDRSQLERRASMTWAQRLKRVFNIDIEICSKCGMGSLLFLDLDNFKRINDTLGHQAGDNLLKAVAKRITTTLRATDFVTRLDEDEDNGHFARLGGDEFTILLAELSRAEDAVRVAKRILAEVSKPTHLQDHDVVVTPSIGISAFPKDGTNADELLRAGYIAMYHAKRIGKNTFKFYDSEMNEEALYRMKLEAAMRKGLEN